MLNSKVIPHKVNKQGNTILSLTALYKKNQYDQMCVLGEKVNVMEKIKAFW